VKTRAKRKNKERETCKTKEKKTRGRKETHAREKFAKRNQMSMKERRKKGDAQVVQVTSVMPKTVLEWKRTALEGRSLVARSPV
jgi:hypothetical protein